MSLEKILDQADDGVDPRVQVELERLNSATDEINKLEVDLDEARNQFRQLLQESTGQIESCAKKLGSCIVKVRPYYDARIKAREALQETQKAAVNFERANSAHAAAKEMVYLAEEGLKAEGRTFDHAWQEMLNHATMRVNESESERTRSEAEHKRTSQNYQLAEIRVRTLQKELKRAITKSRPYFELKIHYTQLLEKQKSKVKNLEKQVAEVKLTYAHTLKNLEQISDEIHKTRQKNRHIPKPDEQRTEGVGAESDSSTEFPSVNSSKNTSGSAKITRNFQNLSKSEKDGKVGNLGDDSETGSPNSENDSSLTGPPDTESEDEIFKFPQQLNCIGSSLHKMKPKSPFTDLKGAGDSKTDTNIIDNFSQYINFDKSQSVSSNAKENLDKNSFFEGVGICSFPIETELNMDFKDRDKPAVLHTEKELEVNPNGSSDWTEIKLRSPEEELFPMMKVSKVKTRNALEEDFDIPYAPLAELEGDFGEGNGRDQDIEEVKRSGEMNSGDREENDKRGMGEGGNGEESNGRSLKGTPRKLNLRRQSLDVLWNNTAGEKVKEILSQSIMKLNIGSLTEKRGSDAKIGEGTEYCENENGINNLKGSEGNYESNLTSQFGIHFFNRKNSTKVDEDGTQIVSEEKKLNNTQDVSISTQLGGLISRKERFFTKKVPSPLEKTLNYLNADDESNSDSESLASSDMLSDEQLTSLVLDRELTEIYQDLL